MSRNRKGPRFPHLELVVSLEAPGYVQGVGDVCHVGGWLRRQDDCLMSINDGKEGGYLRGLYFRAQGDEQSFRDGHRRIKMYGYDIQWNDSCTRADLRSLRAGVKALGEIERKMDKMDETIGNPLSFGDWVRRLAIAIGVGRVLVEGKAVTPHEAQRLIDERVNSWEAMAKKTVAV